MLVECKDLIKIYPTPFKGLNLSVLRGLNLVVNEGDFVVIFGPSGAGKSTLLHLIGAFDVPSSGEVWFDGQLINQFTNRELFQYRKKIGIVHQSPPENLFGGLSVLDNVLFPLRYTSNFLSTQRSRAFELLDLVGLKGKERRKPFQLSGGEQQRVALAVALANAPRLLLADEPTGTLDTQNTAIIRELLKVLNEELGLTLIVVTHDESFSTVATHIYRLLAGKLRDHNPF